MKRDMDLIRKILLAIEAHPKPDSWEKPIDFNIEGHSSEEISYHLKLLAEAGLIEAKDVTTIGKYEWRANCLTWQGHEFLDASRDESRWKKAKRLVFEKTGGLSFEMLKLALVEGMKAAFT